MSFADPDPAVAEHVLREIGQGFLGESRAAATVREQIADFLARHQTEDAPPPILLRGEAGVGKSLLARLIHQAGPRPDGPFVGFDCAAIPPSLHEAQLFGIAPGTSSPPRPGLFQRAHGGTLFIDGVGCLAAAELQPKILWALEKRSVYRVGGVRDEPAAAWIIATTSEDLSVAVRDGRFRADLYQQLGQLDLLIPPLRQRPEDIILLAEHFLTRLCVERNLRPKVFAADARSALAAYSWPGNVRQVKALIDRVGLRAARKRKRIITAAMLALPNWNGPTGRPRPIRR